MEDRKIRVAITHGDTNGVGYELTFKAFEDPTMLELCTPIIYGSPKVAAYHAKTLGIDVPFSIVNSWQEVEEGRINLLNCFGDDDIKVEIGTPTKESGAAALRAVDQALADWQEGAFDVLVTAPVFKNIIRGFGGHTAYMSERIGKGEKGISLLTNREVSVALVTNNLAVKDVPEAITKQKIMEKSRLLLQALRRDLRVDSPRVAVLALNPRCGEEGMLGDEEQDVIIPAIGSLEDDEKLRVFGPYPADDFFGQGIYTNFDGVLAMYHDQGQTPFKTLASQDGVRLTSGLPLVRTAPSQGACFNEAGRGVTDASSMRYAIYTAIDVYRNRIAFDAPLGNPLPKLYHERRDDAKRAFFRQGDSRREKQDEA